MYARIARIGGGMDRFAEFEQLVQEQWLPELRRIPGFVSGHWLVDREAGRVAAVTFWDDEETARSALGELRQIAGDVQQALGWTVEDAEMYDVFADA
jgi:hypothetical protein